MEGVGREVHYGQIEIATRTNILRQHEDANSAIQYRMKILHDNGIHAQGTSKRNNLTIPPRLRPPNPRRPGEQPDAHREHGNGREQYANRNPKDLRDLKRMTRQ